ncbi:MAG: tetratricopeptide repeat protein [Pseudomonadales bacterium]
MNKYQLAALTLCTILAACSTTTTESGDVNATTLQNATPKTAAEAPTRPFPADSFHDLLVAEFAVKRNRYDLALGNYLQQAHRTRDSGVTARATRLAQFLRADKATLDAAQLWVELEPDNLEAQYTLSTMLAKNKRPIEALQHMTVVLENGGKTNFAAIAASSLDLPNSSRITIETRLDQLRVKFPENIQLLTAKSLLLQQRGETEAALTMIRDVLDLDENDLHAVVVEARLLQQLKRGDEAFVRLEKVVLQYPKNRRLRLQYARMLMTKDINLAKQQFEKLLGSSPNDPDLLLSLALISKETDNLDDAEKYFQLLLQSGHRTTEAQHYLGQLAEQRQQWQTAIDHYRLIPPGTDFLAATNRITHLYLQQGRVETARDYLQSIRQQYPEHAVRIYLLESEILLRSNRFEEGHALLSEALLSHPQQANLLYARSMFSEKVGNIDLMEQDLRVIINQDSNNAIALNTLGYVFANRSERLDEAYDLIKRALAIKPNDPAILDSLGWVEFRRGNLQQAAALLTQAYKAFPDHEVAAHLGEVLWIMGRQQQARLIWKQALQRKPDSNYLRETLQRFKVDSPQPSPQPRQPTAANTSSAD